MYKGIVFFDIDGTLIDTDNGMTEIPQSAKDAVLKLRKNNYLTFICTGRSEFYINIKTDIFDGIISQAGATASYNGKLLFSEEFPAESISALIEYANRNHLCYMLEARNCCYCDSASDKNMSAFIELSRMNKSLIKPVSECDFGETKKVICTFPEHEDFLRFKTAFDGRLNMSRQISVNFCDVNMLGISKGTALKKVAEAFSVPIENTYAFGDSDNDYEMFVEAGTAIAMKDHSKRLDPYCDYVTDSVSADGISKAVDKIIL